VTTKLKLGTGIVLVPERNPLLLAKEISTLDLFSGGRFLFGIGAGWLREETELMGGDFDHRWTQTRESILAMKELWTKEEAFYHGEFVKFDPVWSWPKPKQRPHPPIILGGESDPGGVVGRGGRRGFEDLGHGGDRRAPQFRSPIYA